MRSIHVPRWVGLVLLSVLTAVTAAEAQLTRGTISGTVTDGSGAVLPGARITITNQETGLVRSATASDEGLYRVPALEPGLYTVRFELDGFQAAENKNIPVKTSDEVTLNIALNVGNLAEQVQVSAETASAALNKTNPTIGFTAGPRLMVNLPINGDRDINRIALLSPNVVTAPGSTTISVNGQRARNNNFTIDGTDNNDVSVTLSTLDIVPEAVAEFQIQTNAYNVEFGRNSGGQFQIITRSGTNALRGEAWEYYRGSGLNARDNLEKGNNLAEPARSNRNQFGGGVGGPILRNRMFFYGLLQADREREAGALQATVRMPTPAGFAQLAGVPLGSGQTAASRQGVLDRIGFLRDLYALNPTFTSVQNTLVNGVPIETGQTNFGISQPNDTWNTFGRSDVQFNPSNNLTVRYIMNKSDDTNSGSNLNVGERFASNTNTLDQNTAVSHTSIFSPTLLNEARFAYIRRNLDFPENDPTSPTATIGGGFFTIGGLSNFPQGRVQDSYQFSNVLSNQRGRHAIKAGADIRYVRLDNVSAFDSKGSFTFNNFQDYMNNLAVTFTQALQTSSFFATQWQAALFAQDDFKVNPDLTLNLGLRYESSTVPLGFFGATEQQVLDALVPPPVKRDKNNWAPRVGFAWSPSPERGLMRKLFGNGDGVVRGGFGVSYDVLFYNILVVNASNYPRVVTGRLDNAQNVYPNLAPTSAVATFNPAAAFVNTPEDAQNPRTSFWSLSVQRQLWSNYTFEIGYTGNINRNGVNQLQANPATLTPAQAATVVSTGSITSIPTVQQRRDFPNIGARTLIATTAKGEYHAGYLSVKRRFSRGLEAGGSYTFGKNMSDNDESLGVADITAGSPQIPQDYRNIDAEWSLSAFDRKHRFVAHWIYEMPRLGSGWMDIALGGWQLGGVFQAQSGQPFTIVTGVDSNGNGGGGDRPNFNPGGTLTPDPDTGNLRTFTTSNMFEVPRGSNGLPLAFSLGNGDLGRNTLRAAAWFNWDLSLAKRFRLFSSHSVLIRGDFLNAFNQDNYGIPVNSLNNPAFGSNIRNWGNRTITLSAKYSF